MTGYEGFSEKSLREEVKRNDHDCEFGNVQRSSMHEQDKRDLQREIEYRKQDGEW
jgi:hypothetical protein